MEDNIQDCLKRMVELFKQLEGYKEEIRGELDNAFNEYSNTVKFGDDPPSQKALEKLAKAMATEKLEKFSAELKDVANALFQSTGEPTLPFDKA